MNEVTTNLATLKDGKPPRTRMERADSVQDWVNRLINADTDRSKKRSWVNRIVDGNAPYSTGKLRDAGRAEACNVNWGTGRAYMESGTGAFYDLAAEAPGFVAIKVKEGDDPAKSDDYSRIMSAEADRIFTTDDTWDWTMQLSQWDMVLHGCGPMVFEDKDTVFPKAVRCGELVVPRRTRSATKYWEGCAVIIDINPPDLYKFIENEAAATAMGWDVPYTKNVIESCIVNNSKEERRQTWEWYQQELKNNSLNYNDDGMVCRLAYAYWREFDGKITHVIVERETTARFRNNDPIDTNSASAKFLFKSIGRFDDWNQCIHPFYYDRGNGGFHHSVTGLGVKMGAAMEYQNRLLCNLMDKAFAPKILFKPTTTEATQKFALQHLGDYGVTSAGFDAVQNPIAGLLTDGLAVYRATSDLMQSNLSSYRQQVPIKPEGNPVTAKQIMLEASQQSALSKTTFNRYYKQLDMLYAEIVRRLCNRKSTDERAKEFQKRCIDAGVPEDCFKNIDRVEAVRVIGQGSAFTRKAAVDGMMPIAGALTEDGRTNLINDKIAAEAGQAAVNRYNPKAKETLPTDQQAEAIQWTAAMKVGVPPIITASQNPVTYAGTYLSAAAQALGSLQQGADPMVVLSFLEQCGPAIAAQLARFANDPTRQQVWKAMMEQWKQIAKLTDQLRQQVQQSQQQQAQQAQKTQQVMSDQQLKQVKTMAGIESQKVKTQAKLAQDAATHRQQMAIADAEAAASIRRDTATTAHDMSIAERQHEHDMAMAETEDNSEE